jgi:hypothetical protein
VAPMQIVRDYGQPTLRATFANGQLVAIDDSLCVPIKEGESPDHSPCAQLYACGCCRWQLNNNSGAGWVVHSAHGNHCATSDRYSGERYVIEPDANPDTPAVTPTPEVFLCEECLADCRGLSSCCSGAGCLCESQCAPTPATCSLNFCCNAIGCLCRECPCDESWCP